MRLLKVAGAKDSENAQWMSYATLAASVQKIDGNPIGMITSQVKLEGVVQQLDEHGLKAVVSALLALMPPEEEVADAARNL